MKQFALFVSILATLGVWLADFFLLGVPAFRNGWWTLTLFAFPAALLVAGWGGEGNRKLRAAAAAMLVVGVGGWLFWRCVGKIEGTPAVAVGERAPDFMLKDQDGKDVRLSDLAEQQRVVAVFFRGKWCPVCRAGLRGLKERYEDFVNSRVTVIAVGPVTPAEAKAFELPFPVLCDTELEATKKYGLLHEKGLLGKDVPRPTVLLVNKGDRVIKWMRAEDNYRTRPAPDEIFEQLRR